MLHFRMARWFDTVTDLDSWAAVLRCRRHGVIDVRCGQLASIHLRPWPKFVSLAEVAWGFWSHQHVPGDRMRLYYDQPRSCPSFLALKFALSSRDTTLKTAILALRILDKIAQMKRSDAILLDATNFRLSPRMLARFGWESHAPSRWHRNYIKRMDAAGSGFKAKGSEVLLAEEFKAQECDRAIF
ncbi:MAG: hypothetical protein IT427_18650 [Pirellulales bacterium]|nr:hypothetical protein [Pirellulales bacterium]